METLQTQESQTQKPKKKRRGVITAIAIIVIIILLLYLRACGGTQSNGGLELGVIDSGALSTEADKERLQQTLNQQVEEGMVGLFMNTAIDVEQDGYANWLIQNIEQNKFSQQVTVLKKETGEILYESPVIDPGYKVETDKVQKTLDAGTYDCLARFTIMDTETHEAVNTVDLEVKVNFG